MHGSSPLVINLTHHCFYLPGKKWETSLLDRCRGWGIRNWFEWCLCMFISGCAQLSYANIGCTQYFKEARLFDIEKLDVFNYVPYIDYFLPMSSSRIQSTFKVPFQKISQLAIQTIGLWVAGSLLRCFSTLHQLVHLGLVKRVFFLK